MVKCPYCNSEKWEVCNGFPTKMEYGDDYITATFVCVCYGSDCGKKFIEKRYYFDVDDSDYLPVEESE
jgi:hypothetical protein